MRIPNWLLFTGGVFLLILLLVVLPCSLVFSIPAGTVGVLSSFGEVTEEVLPAGGPYFVKPWKRVYRMNLQTQKDEENQSLPTSGGLAVEAKVVLLYKLRASQAPSILREVGQEYQDKVVTPYFKNAVRDVTAKFPPEALYTVERNKVETEVLQLVRKQLEARFEVESVLLLDPVLPKSVAERISAKVGAEQDAIRMESVFKQKELEGKANKRVKELDAEAKVIEAKGIAEAQAIIKKDLDDNYLRYLWIEALKESAKHNNATIYIPTGSDGMPFFHQAAPKKEEPKK